MSGIRRRLSGPRAAGALVFVAAFLVYVRTLSPGIVYIDSGELSAVATTLGIAHPSGYPLFTLIGRVVTLLPVAGESVVSLNLMAAAFCAAAATVFFHLLLISFRAGTRPDPRGAPAEGGPVGSAAAAGGALLLAYSETFWAQALAVEVYSLQVLLVCLILLLLLRAVDAEAVAPERAGRYWRAFAFFLGLAFANHLTTALLGPGLLYYYAATRKERRAPWVALLRLIPWFVLGLTPYAYLPLRAMQGPPLNWGDAMSFENFLRHVGGWQYRVWMLSSADTAGKQLVRFLSSWPAGFGYVGLVLAAIGGASMWRRNRRVFLFTAILFFSTVGYAINYDIHDIDSYFLLAFLMTGLWGGFGIRVLSAWLLRRGLLARGLSLFLPPALCIVPLVSNYTRVDQSRNYVVEDYAANMFSSFAPNALVLSYQWDYWVSASNYLQLVRGVRPDVIVLDKELLRRSWYIAQMENRYGELFAENRHAVDAFLTEVRKFERSLPFDPNLIEARYVQMIRGFLGNGLMVRPVYVTPEIEAEFTRGWQRVPEGLALRVYADSAFHPTPFPEFRYRLFPGNSHFEPFVRRFYGAAFAARAEYYRAYDPAEAQRAASAALAHDPSLSQLFRGAR